MGVKKVIIDANGQAIVVGAMGVSSSDAAVIRYGENGVVDNPSAWLPATSTTVRPVATVVPVATTTVRPVATTPTTIAPVVITATTVMPKIIAVSVKLSKAIAVKSIATFVGLSVLSTSKVSLKVLSSSTKYCKVSGTTLKGLKTGSCKVTVTVTPKKGRATSRTVTLKVTK